MEAEAGRSPEGLAILVVGTDTLIEALPARPIQLAHACGQLGFDLAIPLSWGDELVAEATLRVLKDLACPASGSLHLPTGQTTVTALRGGTRWIAGLVGVPSGGAGPTPPRNTRRPFDFDQLCRCLPKRESPGIRRCLHVRTSFLGSCAPGESVLEEQPDVFVDRIPPDRQRFASLPGGCPTAEMLWRRGGEQELGRAGVG